MVKILNFGRHIKYTKGDTFELPVGTDGTYGEGTYLKFQIAKSEETDILIDHQETMSDNAFLVTLTDEEKAKLQLGEYIYRIQVFPINGGRYTQLSGDFSVVWGVE
ncbi:MAG: hypothetical protein J6C82_04875 [Clostridia bacterium]|nr:hypothetical protein [Clostridia bacterium]MBP1560767.1 hypothetical protein [Oscillospiraceae bacterium]